MKRICTILTGLLLSLIGFSQPAINEVIIPQYMSLEGSKTPFVCRLTITGLNPGATYRYYNKFTEGFSYGDGYCTLISPSGTFTRVTFPSMSTPGTYGEFIADGSGSYTGWFAAEADPWGYIFSQGSVVFVKVFLNDGAGGDAEWDMITADGAPITMLGTDPSMPTGRGTGVRSTPATDGVAKNFVFLYDNVAGTGRPIAGSFIELDGNANNTSEGYAAFYETDVDNVPKTWGTFIPNELHGGIKRIVQYSLNNGTVVGSRDAASGTWAAAGGGRVSTINPTGGTTNVIVLNGSIVTLGSSAKFNQTISFPSTSANYGAADLDPATSTSGLPIVYSSNNPAVATIVSGKVHIVGGGTAGITAKQVGDEDFNPAPDVTQTFTVNKIPLTIKADDKSKVSGDPFPTWTATYTGFVNGDGPSSLNPAVIFQTTALVNSPAGTYPITPGGAGSLNYTITYQPGTLTVTSNKQPQTLTFNAIAPKGYGVADFNPGAVLSSGLTPQYQSSNPAVATIVSNAIHIMGVGTTVITASHPGDANWEPVAGITQTLTVNKTALTIKADDKTKLAGHSNPPLTITYTGFVYGENSSVFTNPVTISTTANTFSLPGNYEISVSGATAANYTITQVKGTLTIQPLPSQTITFQNLPQRKYGDPVFPAGATASSGLPVNYGSSNPTVATVVDGDIHIHSAGSTEITASQPGDADNAPATAVTKTLTVNKVLLTIRAEDKSKRETAANPALTINYTGFVNNDNESVLTTAPVIATPATPASLMGVYPITITGAAATNYNILRIPGKLTVLPALGSDQNTVAAFCSSPDQLQVNIYADTAQKGVIQLFDPAGNRLLNVPVSIGKGANSFRVPIGNVTAGIYYLRVNAKEFIRKEKVRIP